MILVRSMCIFAKIWVGTLYMWPGPVTWMYWGKEMSWSPDVCIDSDWSICSRFWPSCHTESRARLVSTPWIGNKLLNGRKYRKGILEDWVLFSCHCNSWKNRWQILQMNPLGIISACLECFCLLGVLKLDGHVLPRNRLHVPPPAHFASVFWMRSWMANRGLFEDEMAAWQGRNWISSMMAECRGPQPKAKGARVYPNSWPGICAIFEKGIVAWRARM